MTVRLCPLPHRTYDDGTVRQAKAGHGSLLCPGHQTRARHDLEELPGLWRQLGESHVSWQQKIGYASPTAETALPVSEPVVEHCRDMLTRLASWSQLIAEERNVAPPAREPVSSLRIGITDRGMLRTVVTVAPNPVAPLARFLLRHHDWSVGREWAGDYASELRDDTAMAWRLAFPGPERRVPLPVVCPCGGTMVAIVGAHDPQLHRDDMAPEFLWCSACGEPMGWRDAQAQATSDRWVSEDTAVLWAATVRGRLLAGGTIRVWAHRGLVRSQLQSNRVVYWLADVAGRVEAKQTA